MATIFSRDNDTAVRLIPLAEALEQQAETSRSVVNDLGQMTETIITADNGMAALAQLTEQQERMAKTIRNDRGNGNTPERLERMAETLRDLY